MRHNQQKETRQRDKSRRECQTHDGILVKVFLVVIVALILRLLGLRQELAREQLEQASLHRHHVVARTAV